MPKTPTTSANPCQAGAVMDPPQKLTSQGQDFPEPGHPRAVTLGPGRLKNTKSFPRTWEQFSDLKDGQLELQFHQRHEQI